MFLSVGAPLSREGIDMVENAKDFLGSATEYENSLAGKFAQNIDDACRRAKGHGQRYFTVSTSDLPVGVGGPKRTAGTDPYEQVLDTWREAGWTITPTSAGYNETQLEFHPNA